MRAFLLTVHRSTGTKVCEPGKRLPSCATCDSPEAKAAASSHGLTHYCGRVLHIKKDKKQTNWHRKYYNKHLESHSPKEAAALDASETADRVDNITHGKRCAAAAALEPPYSFSPLKQPRLTEMLQVNLKSRQADQDAKLSALLIRSGSSIKKSELLNPYFLAYVRSLDPTSRVLSQTDVTDYSVAERQVLEMACFKESSLIQEHYTFGNPFMQAMSDHVTIHGYKMLSEAACFAPASPQPPAMVALNFLRTPEGSAQAQAAYMNGTYLEVFGSPAREVVASAIFDEGATSTGSALEMVEESCGLHVDSSMQKDMMGQNRTVNGQPSDDFPEITELMAKCRSLGKFILRPKVWSSFEKKRADMDENRESRVSFWRVVLDHCKTRIGAVLSLAESVALDRAMTKIMFSLWGAANPEYPAPDNMPENLSDAEYTVLEEFQYVMGIAKPHQLFTQYEKWYTAALEIPAQKQVITMPQGLLAPFNLLPHCPPPPPLKLLLRLPVPLPVFALCHACYF